jgi:hypothetical protein
VDRLDGLVERIVSAGQYHHAGDQRRCGRLRQVPRDALAISTPRHACAERADERSSAKAIERFQAKWKPVRVKKTRQIKNLEPRFDSIETEKALG